MFPSKSLLVLLLSAVVTGAQAGTVYTFKITDFQGSTLDLLNGSSASLTPWLFFFGMQGDPYQFRIQNAAAPASILCYTTADAATAGAAEHTQIVGRPYTDKVSTFWDVVDAVGKEGYSNLIEKHTRLAMTAWPRSGSSVSSPLTLEQFDAKNKHQVFKLVKPDPEWTCNAKHFDLYFIYPYPPLSRPWLERLSEEGVIDPSARVWVRRKFGIEA
ncbi:hypothetical protein C8R46DRAFT_1041513 [Mycena filopes]|nr:hypothetical protein C8R46DRAFT_1041513 [Mycena filopes]